MINVSEILKAFLEGNGFDGLCSDYCGCGKDDLAPCGGDMDDITQCCAAYHVQYVPEIHGNEMDADPGDWIYTTVKPTERDN
jgi:hypothetical protein